MKMLLLCCSIAAIMLTCYSAETGSPVRPLADDFVVIVESPSPKNIYCYTPGIIRLDSGRLVVTMDFGGKGLKKGESRGRVFTSDDHGMSWKLRSSFSFCHARPFIAGKSLYVLGQAGDLKVF